MAEASAPVFDTEGRYVYAASTKRSESDAAKRDGGCLYRVAAAAPYPRQSLFCTPSEGERLDFKLAADAKTAVVAARLAGPQLVTRYTWLRLPEGRVLGSIDIPLASTFDFSLSSGGILLTSAGGGVVVADAAGRMRSVPGLEHAFVFTTASWDGDRAYAVRLELPKGEEIIRIDARAVLDEGAKTVVATR